MIDTSPSSIRIFAVIVLGIVWIYLLVEQLAITSVKNEKRK
jgi:hypothetical protein